MPHTRKKITKATKGDTINLDSFHKLNPKAKPYGQDEKQMPTPKTAALDKFKLAFADPYYGQYRERGRDDSSDAANTALLMGAGGLGLAGAHHLAMNAQGQLMGGGLINAYQRGPGKNIRDAANSVRTKFDMKPVAQPPHPAVRRALELLSTTAEHAKMPLAALGVGATAYKGLKGMHGELADPENLSHAAQFYRDNVLKGAAGAADSAKALGGKALLGGSRAARWVRSRFPGSSDPAAAPAAAAAPAPAAAAAAAASGGPEITVKRQPITQGGAAGATAANRRYGVRGRRV